MDEKIFVSDTQTSEIFRQIDNSDIESSEVVEVTENVTNIDLTETNTIGLVGIFFSSVLVGLVVFDILSKRWHT